jgi:NADH-quinone oxidoreductase subunit M
MVAIFSNALTWTLLLPVIGALVTLLLPEKAARWAALLFSAATLAVAIGMFAAVLGNSGFGGFGDLQNPQFVVNVPWIHFAAGSLQFNINYHLGVDGLSMPMVLLNCLLTTLAVVGGWQKKRVREYLALLLLLEAGVMGVFISLDLFLFFLFW